MKHIKSFSGNNFKDLLSDQMEFGTDDITDNTVYIEKLYGYWGEDKGFYPNTKKYILCLGPSDDSCLSDSISFTDDFLNSILNSSGATRYQLHSSENTHTLYFDNDDDANQFYDKLLDIIRSYNFKTIGDY